MKLVTDKMPQSKSRFSYSDEESEDEGDGFVSEQVSHVALPPPTDEVSLFRPEMKHIRDRLHAGHQFRPPTDHQMPMQSFYENRFPSMWTTAEDDELRSQVRLYSYNWPLISSVLTGKSMYASGAERRTPWECFERWIQLEGLPSDMQKTAYFKTYSGRIDAASRIIAQQQMAQQNATGQPVRRRPTVPCRVERRRNNKHLTLIDAMRKLAKKRETQLQKQQQTTAHNAATKKPSEPLLNKCKNPAEFSRERWERDQRLAERLAQCATRNDATRRVCTIETKLDLVANPRLGCYNASTPARPARAGPGTWDSRCSRHAERPASQRQWRQRSTSTQHGQQAASGSHAHASTTERYAAWAAADVASTDAEPASANAANAGSATDAYAWTPAATTRRQHDAASPTYLAAATTSCSDAACSGAATPSTATSAATAAGWRDSSSSQRSHPTRLTTPDERG